MCNYSFYYLGTAGGTANGRFPANNDALISEASKGNLQTVMRLITNENQNYQDKNGRTALIAAAEGAHKGRVSVQGVKSLGGHFACLCRGFEFYEVKKKSFLFFKKKMEILLHFLSFL